MKIDRSQKPAESGEITFHLPQKEIFVLSNGLKVIYVKKDKLPIVQMSFAINAGSRYDEKGKRGEKNLLASLIDEGAGEFDALQLNNAFEFLGTQFGISINTDTLFLSALSLSENFDRSCNLIGKILSEPHLNEKDFLREQKKIITRIIQRKDEPDEIADTTFSKIVFGENNPYAYPVIGLERDLHSITSDGVREVYSKFIRPNNSVLVVVGNIERNYLLSTLNTSLEKWKNGTTPSFISSVEYDAKPKIYLVHKKEAAQCEIRVGHISLSRLSPDYFPAMLMNMILGGQFSSRINLNLREDKGFTYGATSNFYYNLVNSYFGVSVSVGTENTSAALIEIYKEIDSIRKNILQEELTFAQSSLIKKFPSQFETYNQVAANLLTQELYSLPDNYFDAYLENVSSVKLDEVLNASKNRIHPDKLVIVIVGDKEKILPQLNSIENYEVVETEVFF